MSSSCGFGEMDVGASFDLVIAGSILVDGSRMEMEKAGVVVEGREDRLMKCLAHKLHEIAVPRWRINLRAAVGQMVEDRGGGVGYEIFSSTLIGEWVGADRKASRFGARDDA